MALSRRGGMRENLNVWPGFVDALASLLLVLTFVLTIFTVMQSVLRETITTQDDELGSLTEQIVGLADALGLERNRAAALEADVASLGADLSAAQAQTAEQTSLITTLTGQLSAARGELDAAGARITGFEAQVVALLAARDAALGQAATLTTERDVARGQAASLTTERDAARTEAGALTATIADLEAAQSRLITDAEALQLSLAAARQEIDANAEAARLAAARTEALNALVADLRSRSTATEQDLTAARTQLSEVEAARMVDQAAADALRQRLAASDSELTALTLALEEQRRRAEETLTLLAAAETTAAQEAAATDQRAALLSIAGDALSREKARSAEGARQVALLNEQVAALRGQLGALQDVIDASAARDSAARVQLEQLGGQLNGALAQVAAEQRRRAELEEKERVRLEAETKNLERYRSEFFGQLRELLAGREGVRVVGDRFVFSSEVLFPAGSADLLPEGRAQIAGVVATLNDVAGQIPDSIDWIIRVDGHTDNVPLSGIGAFADNWELSQARALSVVRFMQDDLGFPPQRMAATGFGEYRPVSAGTDPASRALNRRIELKLTER